MMLGWLHYVRGVPKGALTLEALVPSSEREGVKVFFDYCQVEEGGCFFTIVRC